MVFIFFISMDGVYAENRQERFQCTINYSLFTALTELADTLIYLIRLADKLDINLLTAAQSKIKNVACPQLRTKAK